MFERIRLFILWVISDKTIVIKCSKHETSKVFVLDFGIINHCKMAYCPKCERIIEPISSFSHEDNLFLRGCGISLE